MDVVTLALAKKGAKQYTDTVIGNLPKGIVFKGSVNYFSDLPNNAEIGDCYTVLYSGDSGLNPSGVEYVWGLNTETSINEWIAIGPDLTDYVKNTDYATTSKAGIVKGSNAYGVAFDGASIRGQEYNYTDYENKVNTMFISKGTLENVITGKELTNKTYVDNLVGDIETVLTTLDTGSGV